MCLNLNKAVLWKRLTGAEMGNTYSQAPARPYDDTLLHDVPGITRESHLGKGRFLKTLKVIHDEGTAVCKIFIKPTAALSLEKQVARLQGSALLPFLPIQIRAFYRNCIHDSILNDLEWVYLLSMDAAPAKAPFCCLYDTVCDDSQVNLDSYHFYYRNS